jgi:hypothetical protein
MDKAEFGGVVEKYVEQYLLSVTRVLFYCAMLIFQNVENTEDDTEVTEDEFGGYVKNNNNILIKLNN